MGDPLSGNRRADGAWFVYARMPGRITGYPANWKGLAFLIGSILGVTALGLLSAHLWNTTGQIDLGDQPQNRDQRREKRDIGDVLFHVIALLPLVCHCAARPQRLGEMFGVIDGQKREWQHDPP